MSPIGSALPSFLLKQAHRSVCRRKCILRRQFLHTTVPNPATPLPITAHGPPPKAPLPAVSQHDDRTARRKNQAEMLRQAQDLRSAEKPSGRLKSRFWKNVSVQETPEYIVSPDGLQIHLDSRPVRTPSKAVLNIPHSKSHLAFGIALEWDYLASAQQALKQHLIPLTFLVSRADDIKTEDQNGESRSREEVVEMVMRFLDTDTLLCWAPETSSSSTIAQGMSTQLGDGGVDNGQSRNLRDLQSKTAQPIIDFLTTHIWPGAEIHPSTDSNSIMPSPQPQITKDIIRGWVTGLPAYELSGLERAVLATKSLLVAARFVAEWSPGFDDLHRDDTGAKQARFGIDEAQEAATVEVRWQTKMWGEVEDTHDVDREDLRRQLGSVIMLITNNQA
ncbi:MAG: ATP synthase complex assembly protein atp12 [Sclerophora amabilis]|nr:MAG: ATP synthase complex assembly protein atp12 [Sclerophora amabilis]